MSGSHAPDILVIGASNRDTKCRPSDVMAKMADSHPGIVIQSDGGVARNMADVFGRLHCHVGLITAVGDDHASEALLQNLTTSGVDISYALRCPNTGPDSYVAIHDDKGEVISAINHMTLIDHIVPEVIHNHHADIARAKIVVADCNLPQDTLQAIANITRDGLLAIDGVSMAKVTKLLPIMAQIDILKLNRAEASRLIDKPEQTPAHNMISDLHATGAKQILLSDGRNGIYLNEGAVTKHFAAKEALPETVSGAGDCLFAGFLFGLLTDQSITQSATYAIKAAELSTRTISAVNNHITLQQILK